MIYQAVEPDPPKEPAAPPPSPAPSPIKTIQQPPEEPLVQTASPQRNQEDEPSKREPESTDDKNDDAAVVVRPESPLSDEEDDLPTKAVIVCDFTTCRDLGRQGNLLYETNGTCTFVERGPYKVICKTRRRGDTAGSTDAYVYVSRHRLNSGRVIKSKVLRSLRDIDNHFGP